MAWLPSMIDVPMGLGDHLHELRRRLVVPLIVVCAIFIGAFAFQNELKQVMVQPLKHAIRLVGPQTAMAVGLVRSQAEFDEILSKPLRCLTVLSIAESTTTAVKISLSAAIAVALPVILFQIWNFVAVGLTRKERRLAFLFVPLGVIFFYAGTLIGYFFGLPYFYAMLINFTATDQTAVYQLRQADYVEDFTTWTVSFGLIMDIPWLVMVLVRSGMVTPQQIARARRYVVAGNLILSACLTPTADLFSLVMLFIPIQLLFEAGLLASRFMVPKPKDG
ncbi:MAG: twin-arginine translocase subunit TatC [Planctomycetes bacterium]|nr:twin-arginine translocase subunit TatC [Planctomycetota bacterium]